MDARMDASSQKMEMSFQVTVCGSLEIKAAAQPENRSTERQKHYVKVQFEDSDIMGLFDKVISTLFYHLFLILIFLSIKKKSIKF